jgi:hypothetical protein
MKPGEDGAPERTRIGMRVRLNLESAWMEMVLGGSMVIIVRSDDKRQQGAKFAPCGGLSQI